MPPCKLQTGGNLAWLLLHSNEEGRDVFPALNPKFLNAKNFYKIASTNISEQQ